MKVVWQDELVAVSASATISGWKDVAFLQGGHRAGVAERAFHLTAVRQEPIFGEDLDHAVLVLVEKIFEISLPSHAVHAEHNTVLDIWSLLPELGFRIRTDGLLGEVILEKEPGLTLLRRRKDGARLLLRELLAHGGNLATPIYAHKPKALARSVWKTRTMAQCVEDMDSGSARR